MISILIPIYNEYVVRLVEDLLKQCRITKIPFEIICLDDCSEQKYKSKNRALNHLFGVNYVELKDKHGRSKIRNRLASLARYDHLLYIDSDSKIISKQYIKKYVKAIKENPKSIIYGGRSYPKKAPKNKSLRLHWKYGLIRESPPAAKRNKRKTELLHSNNLITPRTVIEKFPFNKSLYSYGYEDIYWAFDIGSHHEIIHIDNPIKHSGLKKTELFLKDTTDSIINLVKLYRAAPLLNTRLIRAYKVLLNLKIDKAYIRLLNPLEDQIIKRLNRPNPKLIYLDLFKLHYFAKEHLADRI